MVTRGYYKKPDETRAAFTDDGWFRSGDLGVRDAAGHVVFKGRLRETLRISHFMVAPGEIEDSLKQVRSRYKSDAEYQRDLREYRLTEQQVREALVRQTAALRFLDVRFRPEVQVNEFDLRDYYEKVCLPEYRRRQVKPEPTFDESRAECEEALSAQLVNKRAEAWLKDVRLRMQIKYQEDAFQ